MRTIKANINGEELPLTGDDESILLGAVDELNNQIKEIKAESGETQKSTLSILAALNLAEKKIKADAQLDADKSFIQTELNKMAGFLYDSLKK